MRAEPGVEEHNARIERTMLGIEDHGIMTGYVFLDYGGSAQGFGGYVLRGRYMESFVSNVLRVAGVTKWESLVGCYVRARSTNDKVYAIGHILKDEWYDIKSVADALIEKYGDEKP